MSLILNISIYYFPSSLYDNWASSHFRVTFYVIANIALGLQSSVFFFFFQTTAVSELLAFCPLPTSSALSLGHSWGKECALHIILQQSSPAVISLESKYGSGANFFFSSPHQRIFNRLCVSSGKLPKHLWCYSFSFFFFVFFLLHIISKSRRSKSQECIANLSLGYLGSLSLMLLEKYKWNDWRRKIRFSSWFNDFILLQVQGDNESFIWRLFSLSK